MIYLRKFRFPTADREQGWFMRHETAARNTYYPFQVLAPKGLEELTLEPITVLYGGNGSGKTTVLNIIAERLGLVRDSLYNRSDVFEEYTALCGCETEQPIPRTSRIVASDDVFDHMLHLRSVNREIDGHRQALAEEYGQAQAPFQLHSLADHEELKRHNEALRASSASYIRRRLDGNVRERSNGESAFAWFSDRIDRAGLYLLDEPENSLSPVLQQELVRFLEDSARFCGCQFLIATHSPFLLAMQGARIYDMDAEPPSARAWTELPNVRVFYDFFSAHRAEFEGEPAPKPILDAKLAGKKVRVRTEEIRARKPGFAKRYLAFLDWAAGKTFTAEPEIKRLHNAGYFYSLEEDRTSPKWLMTEQDLTVVEE